MKFVCTCLLILIVGACTIGSANPAANQSKELVRVVSPDSVVDGVLTVGSVDATTSNVYRVYVVPHRQPVPLTGESEVFRADQVDSLQISWTGVRMLGVRYEHARIFHFSNFWLSAAVKNFEYVVELRLEPLQFRSVPEQIVPRAR